MKKLLLALAMLTSVTTATDFEPKYMCNGHVDLQYDEKSGWEIIGNKGYWKYVYTSGNDMKIQISVDMTEAEYKKLDSKINKFGFIEIDGKSYELSIFTMSPDDVTKESYEEIRRKQPDYKFPLPNYQFEITMSAEEFLKLTAERNKEEIMKKGLLNF